MKHRVRGQAADPRIPLRRNLAARLVARFSLRWHMTLILLATVAAGVLASRALAALGVETMAWRYPLATIVAWCAFLLGIRLWLYYVGLRGTDRDSGEQRDLDALDAVDVGNVGLDLARGGTRAAGDIVGRGGGFGGGGAQAGFGEAGVARSAPNVIADEAGGGGWGMDAVDGDAMPVLLAIAAIALVGGAIIYLFNLGPVLLVDVAVEAVLASALVRPARHMDAPDWVGSVVKATAVPFGCVLFATWMAGMYLDDRCPEATSMAMAWNCPSP